MAATDSTHAHVHRHDDLLGTGLPLMFIDSVLPGHLRMNYAVIGDTASEDPSFEPHITAPHKFQIGKFWAPPGNGPGWHTHDYIEMFMPLTQPFHFFWGANPEDPDDVAGDAVLQPFDCVSMPAGLWRRFECCGTEGGWGFAVLEQHEVFESKDPHWPEFMVAAAAAEGLQVDELGKMIKPADFDRIEQETAERIGFEPELAARRARV